MTALHSLKKETKVIIFSGNVISYSNYHHGDASLNGTIITMAQKFQNMNNIPYILGVGQFGNVLGDKPAAPRYISVAQNPLISQIFLTKFLPILNYPNDDEGDENIPEYLFPIIPMILVNGC